MLKYEQVFGVVVNAALGAELLQYALQEVCPERYGSKCGKVFCSSVGLLCNGVGVCGAVYQVHSLGSFTEFSHYLQRIRARCFGLYIVVLQTTPVTRRT